MPPLTNDFLALALKMPRTQFVTAHPVLFLVGRGALVAPDGPRRTMALENSEEITQPLDTDALDEEQLPPPMLIAVRKTTDNFPSMITVGRTANNDVVLVDVSVSKFHAHFKTLPSGVALELHDAGSRNGTWADGRAVERGTPVKVAVGARLRFGRVDLSLIDAGRLWDEVRHQPDW